MRHSIVAPFWRMSSCAERQRLARGHQQLGLDQIDAGDHFGHGMLDLNPGVHLDEVEIARRGRR